MHLEDIDAWLQVSVYRGFERLGCLRYDSMGQFESPILRQYLLNYVFRVVPSVA